MSFIHNISFSLSVPAMPPYACRLHLLISMTSVALVMGYPNATPAAWPVSGYFPGDLGLTVIDGLAEMIGWVKGEGEQTKPGWRI